MEKNKIR